LVDTQWQQYITHLHTNNTHNTEKGKLGSRIRQNGRIILGWIFRKWDVGVWTGLGWLRIKTGGGQL
jgi:hypothetical protein